MAVKFVLGLYSNWTLLRKYFFRKNYCRKFSLPQTSFRAWTAQPLLDSASLSDRWKHFLFPECPPAP